MTAATIKPGHVSRADLQGVLKELLPALNSAPSDSPEAFVEAAMLWLSRWVAEHGETKAQSAAPFAVIGGGDFSTLHIEGSESGWTNEPFFRDELTLAAGGHIVLTTASMLEVFMRPTAAASLSELGKDILALGLGERPMIVVLPARKKVMVCPRGVNGPRVAAALDLTPVIELSEEVIDEELKRFHAQHTQFPNGYSHVFHDRKGRVLRSDAEDCIRDDLYRYFKWLAFRSKYIAREDHTPAGRTDLSIYDTQQNNRLACVIELKVLRSRGMSRKSGGGTRDYSAATTFRHARMGVRQAQKYKEVATPNALWGYICLFDGRDADEDMPEVKAVADTRGVLYRRYFMENSARDDLEI